MPLSRDDFARWREDPVTRAVMSAFRLTVGDCERAWKSASWDNGQANPLLLKELRTRADAYEAIEGLTFEGLLETLGETEAE